MESLNRPCAIIILLLLALIYFKYSFSPDLSDKCPEFSVHQPDKNHYSVSQSDNVSTSSWTLLPQQPPQGILCFIPTYSERHDRVRSVKETWGKRCDKLLFFSDQKDDRLGTIKLLNVTEHRFFLWMKTVEALKYIYRHHFQSVDWIIKADDDTYVILEHLREFLSNYSANDDHLIGLLFKDIHRDGHSLYVSGGAGYILSKAALKKFALEALSGRRTKCNFPPALEKLKKKKGILYFRNKGEDLELTNCLRSLNVTPEDAMDKHGRARFIQFALSYHASPHKRRKFYESLAAHVIPQGIRGISDTLIGMHRVGAAEMYAIEYLLYYSKPVQQPSTHHKNSDFQVLSTSGTTATAIPSSVNRSKTSRPWNIVTTTATIKSSSHSRSNVKFAYTRSRQQAFIRQNFNNNTTPQSLKLLYKSTTRKNRNMPPTSLKPHNKRTTSRSNNNKRV